MRKILIIDDDNIVIFLQRKMLEKCGIAAELSSFQSAPEALDFLAAEEPENQYLLLLDINMPGMSGWEMLNELGKLKIFEQIWVVMVTSSVDRFDKDMAEKYDRVVGFVEKPVSVADCKEMKAMPGLDKFFEDQS